MDLQSSRSSLTNIPERDRPSSPPLNSYSLSSRYQREIERGGGGGGGGVGEEGGYYRSTSPPVRDSAPSSRPPEYPYSSSSSRYEGYGSATALDMATTCMSEAPTKFSEYTTIPEMDEPVFHPSIPGGGGISGLPPAIGGSSIAHMHGRPLSHKNVFSSVSSQMTVESQQMLTPFSQQQTPSQQQHQQQQHLDKLSMDVMMHTQLSGASTQGGITSLIPKAKNVKTTDGKPHLGRSDLKELDVDEIDLEKQRIRLMFYEQQKQENESSKPVVEEVSCHRKNEPLDCEPLEDEDKEEHLSIEQMKQELESLDVIVSDQKRRYREIKMAREREEQSLKQAEKELFAEISPNDQHQWHVEQKRRLREREKLKSEQNERLKHLQNDEHKAKSRLKAIEAQTAVIRQQLQKAEALKGFPQQNRSPTQAKHSSISGGGFIDGYDVFPSKLPSDERPRGEERAINQSAVVEWDLGGLEGPKSITARVMSVESMSTAMTFDQPEIARELATTISASVLTDEPTQDDSCPSKGPPCGYTAVRPVSGGYLHNINDDFFSTKSHSRNTLITEPDENIFLNQDERLRREHLQSMVTIESVDSSLPSLRSMDDSGRDFTHSGGHQSGIRGYNQQLARDEMQQQQQQLAFRRTNKLPSSGGQSSNHAVHSHDQAWSSSKQLGGDERDILQNDQTSVHYDIPADARAAYNQRGHHHQPNPSNSRQHGRHHHHRPRGSSSTSAGRNRAMDLPSLDRPVQDAPPPLVKGNPGGAPDVVPVSYSSASPLPSHMSPTLGIQQRHVTGSESVTVASVQPPRSPNFAIYDVPPSRNEREKYLGAGYSAQPSSPIPVQPSPHHESAANFPLQHQVNSHMTNHVTGMPPPSSPIAPTDNIYDQPRSVAGLHSSHSPRPTTGIGNGPLYDVPASARRSAGYEGAIMHMKQDQQANIANASHLDQHSAIREREGNIANSAPKSKAASSHRYGISKSGMGHSYSRGRPDQVQQIDKAKQYMVSRSYRQQSGAGRNIQRQQTDL